MAWQRGGTVFVAELKSLTSENEERQLPLAIGQVVRSRQQLSGASDEVQAVIAPERAPTDPSWLDLCNDHGIILAWP